MPKPEWGTKRMCTSCGAKFYDFNKHPLTCPKCDSRVEPDTPFRSKRPTPAKPPEPKKPVVVEPVIEPAIEPGVEVELAVEPGVELAVELAVEPEKDKVDGDAEAIVLVDDGIEIEDDDDAFAALADDDDDDVDVVSSEIAKPRPDEET